MSFTLYSVLKNEDAIPYIGNNIIAIADGLGGSGSTVHSIDRKNHIDMKSELMKSAFSDFEEEKLKDLQEYLCDLLKPMIDDVDDTSALWGARIAIFRYIYALLKDDKFKNIEFKESLEELSNYIKKGLINTAEHFDLQKGKYDNQLILPTTLAGFRYKEQNENIVIDALWAGDSRCYILTKEGLKQVSIDDEDASGAITNLFAASDKNTKLNYREIKLSKPCILLAVSDGFFDPFGEHDNFGLEHVLLESINQSNTTNELREKLLETFDNYHADDATMAFVPIGFDNFEQIKLNLKERTEYILDIYNQFKSNIKYLNLKDVDKKNLESYIYDRVKCKYDSISKDMIEMTLNEKQDSIISNEIKDIIEKFTSSNEEQLDKIIKSNEEQLFNTVKNKLCKYDAFPFKTSEKKEIDKLKRAFDMNLKSIDEIVSKEKDIQAFASLKEKTINDLEINESKLIDFEKKFLADEKESKKNEIWECIGSIKLFITDARRLLSTNYGKLHYIKKTEKYIQTLNEITTNLLGVKKSLKEYEKLPSLKQNFLNMKASFDKENEHLINLFKEKFKDYKPFINYCIIDYTPLTEEEIQKKVRISQYQALNQYFIKNKDQIINYITKNIALNEGDKSIIENENYFNMSKLNAFKLINKYENVSKESLIDLEQKLEELEEAYTIK